MVSASIIECIGGTPLVRLRRLFSHGPQVYAKLELLNPGGASRIARRATSSNAACATARSRPARRSSSSSSGNFGIALAMAARIYELDFVCVVDPRIAPLNLRILEQLGARVEMVERPDPFGGYLHTRLERVQELLAEIPGAYWIDQYANELNARCHYDGIGQRDRRGARRGAGRRVRRRRQHDRTLIGAARRLRDAWPGVRVVAVDAQGSVIFGGPPRSASLPGIGSSRTPGAARRGGGRRRDLRRRLRLRARLPRAAARRGDPRRRLLRRRRSPPCSGSRRRCRAARAS